MTKRVGAILCLLAALCITMAAQSEPILTILNMPHYPWMARQARIEGVVKVAFTLQAGSEEPTKVDVISGPLTSEGTSAGLLNTAAVENVKAWRFKNRDAVEHRYVTTFDFQIAGDDEVVTFQSFHRVTVQSGGGKIISN